MPFSIEKNAFVFAENILGWKKEIHFAWKKTLPFTLQEKPLLWNEILLYEKRIPSLSNSRTQVEFLSNYVAVVKSLGSHWKIKVFGVVGRPFSRPHTRFVFASFMVCNLSMRAEWLATRMVFVYKAEMDFERWARWGSIMP